MRFPWSKNSRRSLSNAFTKYVYIVQWPKIPIAVLKSHYGPNYINNNVL